MSVLHLLSRRPLYGYEVMKTLQEAFPGVYDGSIYAVLRRLRTDGYAETYMGGASGGPPRKYYRLTDAGLRRFEEALMEWKSVLRAVERLNIPV